jgi:transketolase
MQGGVRTVDELKKIATDIRKDIVSMLEAAGSGHSAGSLDLADIFTVLYFHSMKYDPKKPNWEERDVLFLSNGHTVPAQYAAMARAGYFPLEELKTLRKFGSRLQGHPERTKLPGLESTSGPLGCGLGQAAGFAYDIQYFEKQVHRFSYVIMGDGELDEGNIWESALFAGKYKLGHLIAFVDRNDIQLDGNTEDIMPLGDLVGKWQSFGWHVQEINGNNVKEIIEAIDLAKAIADKPCVIIARTIPGKGVDFMEYDYKWHGISPDEKQKNEALEDLDKECA